MDSLRLAIVASSAIALAGCFPDEEAEAEDPIRVVRTLAVASADPVRSRSFPSVLEPLEITPLAFDVGGRLGALDLRVGQSVAVGETLATVEAADATLRLRQAEAALSEAEIAAANARSEADRQEQLFARSVASEAARDRAVTAADQADARVTQARRSLDLLTETLADTTLSAPFDGVVNSIEVQAFGSVQPGQPVVTLYPEEGLQATVLVSYDVVGTLALGDSISVLPTDGAAAPLAASVTEIAQRAPAVSSFPVIVTLAETRPDLRSGMAVEILVETPLPEAERGIEIPMSAVALNRALDLDALPRAAEVFVARPTTGGMAELELTPVSIGAVVGSSVYVTEGLGEDDLVVTAGVSFLNPRQIVRLMDTAAETRLAAVSP